MWHYFRSPKQEVGCPPRSAHNEVVFMQQAFLWWWRETQRSHFRSWLTARLRSEVTYSDFILMWSFGLKTNQFEAEYILTALFSVCSGMVDQSSQFIWDFLLEIQLLGWHKLCLFGICWLFLISSDRLQHNADRSYSYLPSSHLAWWNSAPAFPPWPLQWSSDSNFSRRPKI